MIAPVGKSDPEKLVITVRPEKIKFTEVGDPSSRVSATVADVVYVGSMTQYIVELTTGEQLVVHRLNDEVRGRPIVVGDDVVLHWAAEHSFVIEEARAEAGDPAPSESEYDQGVEAAP